jgi:hypothetical protein
MLRRPIALLLGVFSSVLLMGTTWFWPSPVINETGKAGAVDYGQGPGRSPAWAAHQAATTPTGPATANVTGWFSAPVPWPVEPIHMALLPDGRVMNFGTATTGQVGASLVYDIWTPSLGTGTDAHMMLPNTTATNLFCGSQVLIPATGELTIVGGSLVQGQPVHYYGINNVTAFQPSTNTISAAAPMVYARWYPSMVSLPNGKLFVAGGTSSSATGAIATPELFDPVNGWVALNNATSTPAFATGDNWSYPRIFLEPSGNLIDLAVVGGLFAIDPTGSAPTAPVKSALTQGRGSMPAAMFAPGKILTMRAGNQVQVVDLTGQSPSVTATANIDQERDWANMTVLADGTVLVNGGSAVPNQLVGVDNTAEIWNPATGTWTAGASAAIPRLYHSVAMLLPDATVVTGGGGDPGPVRNLNAEIYYPPYLYGRNGVPAFRPKIDSAPSTAQIGGTLDLTVDAVDKITGVTLVRAGAVTHSANLEQRFFSLTFAQSGQQVTAALPTNQNEMEPGFYMVFVFEKRTPSIARLVQILM